MLPLLLVLTLTALVALLAVRLRRAHRRTRTAIRKLAVATGHPAALGRGATGWGDRRELADTAAHYLAGLGLVAERRTPAPIVRVRAASGQYVLTVAGGSRVIVEYETADGTVHLGEFPAINGAVRTIATHAELPTPA